MKTVGLILLFLAMTLGVQAKKYRVCRNIPYVSPAAPDYDRESHVLDVYVPKQKRKSEKKKRKVLVFIHGGAWKGGTKNSIRHRAIGRAFASNGIVTVLINYRLWPETKYYGMADDCARALVWVKQHIADFGGDPNDISVSGHSSGGHLAALITTDSSYFMKTGVDVPIRNCILNDPFGLNMFEYLSESTPVDRFLFHTIFTDLPTEWMRGSPYYHINRDEVRYYLIHGAETMPIIKHTAKEFHERSRFVGNYSHHHEVPLRTHIPMVDLFCHKNSKELQKVIDFLYGREVPE